MGAQMFQCQTECGINDIPVWSGQAPSLPSRRIVSTVSRVMKDELPSHRVLDSGTKANKKDCSSSRDTMGGKRPRSHLVVRQAGQGIVYPRPRYVCYRCRVCDTDIRIWKFFLRLSDVTPKGLGSQRAVNPCHLSGSQLDGLDVFCHDHWHLLQMAV